MDDNKEQGLNPESQSQNGKDLNQTDKINEEAAKKAKDALSKYDKREDYSEGELEKELERLTVLFRDELKKASDEAENAADKADDTDDADDADDADDSQDILELDDIKEQLEQEVIPEDMLCRCCSERARNTDRGEDYEYCEVCREGMIRYPIGIQYLFLAVIMVFLAAISVFAFYRDFDALYRIRQVEILKSESKMVSAATKYSEAASVFDERGLNAKRLKLKAVEMSYESITSFSSVNTIASRLDELLSPFEYKLLWNKKYYDIRNQLLTISATLTAYSDIASQYQEEDEYPYERVVSELEELIGETTEIDAPKSTSNAAILFSDPDKTIVVEYDEAFIKFCQYLMLFQKGGEEDIRHYLEDVRELAPEYVWLYGYELGMDYAKSGIYDEAAKMSNLLLEKNIEDPYAYLLESVTYRLQKDYESAEKSADKGIETCGDISELYRLKAICYMLTERYDEALDIMESLVDANVTDTIYIETIYTYAIAADLANNKKAIDSADDMIEYYGLEYSERLQSYFNDELSAEQLFTTDTCDVID